MVSFSSFTPFHLFSSQEHQKIDKKKENAEVYKIKEKWNELGLEPEWVDDYYQDVSYLVKTKLIYSIVGFQNSTENGLKENEIKIQSIEKSNQKGLWIKKEGQWEPLSKIRKEILWKAKNHALTSKNCELKKWSYFSGLGLTPFHVTYEHQLAHHPNYADNQSSLHPVTKLSKKELDTLLNHAKEFEFKSHRKTESSSFKGAIQFVTHPTSTFNQSYLQNLNAQVKTHCGVRLITSDGFLYSFGFGGSFQENQLNHNEFRCLSTINGQPKNLDYMEFQKYEQRLVTTIPLTEIQAQQLLDQLNKYRFNGLRFNILKQNCARFSTHILSLLNIDLNIRISLLATAWRSLPSVKHLPLIGSTIHFITKRGEKSWESSVDKIPFVVKHIFSKLTSLVFYFPQLFLNFLLNLGMFALGGRMGSSNFSLALEKDNSSQKMENFDVLVSSLFDTEAAYVYHSSIFVHWQLKQKTTEAYAYSGQPHMNILPPLSEQEKLFSIQKKQHLTTVYQESTEIE